MKFISWNVNGIRACAQKGFMDIFNEADADIFCIQESKMQAGQLELDTPGYPTSLPILHSRIYCIVLSVVACLCHP